MANKNYRNTKWIGCKFNMLTVIGIERVETKCGEKEWWWRVKCDCGREKLMRSWYVANGHNVSCGCYSKKIFEDMITKHGESHTRLHTIWSSMLERCRDTRIKFNYRYYGRGIKVCEEWHDYGKFSQWAKANGYQEGLSIERIDNDGDYCPENCKWIKRNLQQRNRSTTLWVEFQGRKMSLAEACEIADLPYKTVFARYRQLGWPLEKALSEPVACSHK